MSTKSKLKKYQVQLINTEYGWVEVEAKNEGEARVKAEELVFEGEAHWVNSELETDTVEEIK